MSDRAPVPLAHAGGQVLVGANGSGSPSTSSSTTTGWTIIGHARGNGAGPFAVLEALENLGALQTPWNRVQANRKPLTWFLWMTT